MDKLLAGRWRHVRDVDRQGGQGHSFQALDQFDGTHVFVKMLKRDNPKARKRFRREVAAYETVQGIGLPRLIHDNSDQWDNKAVKLFMVLEWIEGESLQSHVHDKGALSLRDAVDCMDRLGSVLRECHELGVAHRDLKPANVMLRGGFANSPILVDFGLSFNVSEFDDVTRVEEIGNRFLRLPEHAAEGNSRSHVSDINTDGGATILLFDG